jgi:hypothetical protein
MLNKEEDWEIYGAGRGGSSIRRGGPRREAGRKPRGRGAKSIRSASQEGNESEEVAVHVGEGPVTGKQEVLLVPSDSRRL